MKAILCYVSYVKWTKQIESERAKRKKANTQWNLEEENKTK